MINNCVELFYGKIEAFYRDAIADKYITEFNKYTRNLSVYVEKDGVQELIKDKVNLDAKPITINYGIAKNGRYDFVVKTRSGEEVARETIQINNIVKPKEPPYVLTKEEAEGIWETDGNGTITKYTGQETNVVVPVIIGTEFIEKLGITAFTNCTFLTDIKICGNITGIGYGTLVYITEGTFNNCASLRNVVIDEGVQSIGGYAFRNCTSLVSITFPDSVKYFDSFTDTGKPNSIQWGGRQFEGCTNLIEINFASGIHKIPGGQPWYAPNKDISVKKLEK